MILTKFVQDIGNIVPVDVMKLKNFLWSHFLTIMQNVNMWSVPSSEA